MDGPRDYVFVGDEAKACTSGGAHEILDITDPTNQVHLVEIPGKGHHAEIAVHQNLMLQGIGSSSSNAGGDPAEAAIATPMAWTRTTRSESGWSTSVALPVRSWRRSWPREPTT